MSDEAARAKRLVQFDGQPHWLAERRNPTDPRFSMDDVNPAICEAYLYAMMKWDFLGLYQDTGVSILEELARTQIEYTKYTMPAKYHGPALDLSLQSLSDFRLCTVMPSRTSILSRTE